MPFEACGSTEVDLFGTVLLLRHYLKSTSSPAVSLQGVNLGLMFSDAGNNNQLFDGTVSPYIIIDSLDSDNHHDKLYTTTRPNEQAKHVQHANGKVEIWRPSSAGSEIWVSSLHRGARIVKPRTVVKPRTASPKGSVRGAGEAGSAVMTGRLQTPSLSGQSTPRNYQSPDSLMAGRAASTGQLQSPSVTGRSTQRSNQSPVLLTVLATGQPSPALPINTSRGGLPRTPAVDKDSRTKRIRSSIRRTLLCGR